MNRRINFTLWVRTEVTVIWLLLLICAGSAWAESAKPDYIPSLLPAAQEEQSMLIRRLQNVRKDIEAYRVIAENLRKSGDTKALAQLQTPVDDFLKKHVDNLLVQVNENSTLETSRLTAEIMYIKTVILLRLNKVEAARDSVAELKKRFGSYQKISVDLPGNKTSLDEGIRLIDEELAAITTQRKK